MIDEENLNQLVQPIISFHIRQRYIQLENEFQSILSKFQSVRQQLTDDERSKVDHELETQFNRLHCDCCDFDVFLNHLFYYMICSQCINIHTSSCN